MEKFEFGLKNQKCEVIMGDGLLGNLKNLIDIEKCFFIIDKFIYENYYDLYFKNIDFIEHEKIYLIDSVEKNKDFNSVISIVKKMSEHGYLRDSILVGIGGGITGDLTGFIASIYMRGIEFINVPTTLLSQVDSSIGGKNAVNLQNCKNLIGTFNHPSKVLIDTGFIYTLSKRELISGLAEVIKYGIICEYDFLNYISDNLNNILHIEKRFIDEIVNRSCNFKIDIIRQDEYDVSIRKILNHGHTIGHAIEAITNYSIYTHGEAIIIGMFYESLISFKMGLIDEKYFDYIRNLLKKFEIKFDPEILNTKDFYDALRIDKKNKVNKISFILPISPSRVKEYMFSIDEVKKFNIFGYYF